MDKRGQSALEYLMTYGWALVVIVIVVAALVFLMNPQQIGASNCTGFAKLPINNFTATATSLNIVFTNETGRALSNVDMNAHYVGADGITYHVPNTSYNGNDSIPANAEINTGWTFVAAVPSSYTVDLNVTYNDGDFVKTETASCKGTV